MLIMNRWNHMIDLDREADADNDEAQCERCMAIADRDDAIRVDDEMVCELCAVVDGDLDRTAIGETADNLRSQCKSDAFQIEFMSKVAAYLRVQ